MWFDPVLLVITIVFTIVGMIVSARLRNKFAEYAHVPVASGMSGKEIAEKMLHDHHIYDVKVITVDGQLTDHYHPGHKTVNLSHDVYHGRNVAAAAVAAHECGHAVQHATAYTLLGLRSVLVPVVSISSALMNFVLLAMLIFAATSKLYNSALLVVIALQAVVTFFAVITLPVELDASNRALAWLGRTHLAPGAEYDAAKDALKWAARTYIVAALAAIATLFYFIMRYMGSRRD